MPHETLKCSDCGRDGPSAFASGRPPHRSERAELPHSASTSGSIVKAVPWIGMDHTRVRKPVLAQTVHPFPNRSRALAASPEGVPPGAKDLGAESAEATHVGGHSVIREVAAHHRLDSLSLRG